jgi:hypothetical protein
MESGIAGPVKRSTPSLRFTEIKFYPVGVGWRGGYKKLKEFFWSSFVPLKQGILP